MAANILLRYINVDIVPELGVITMTEIERLKKKLKKANDDYHEAINDVLTSDVLYVEHKVAIATKAKTIFTLMEEILTFPLEEKE